jgi:hypothetical protein
MAEFFSTEVSLYQKKQELNRIIHDIYELNDIDTIENVKKLILYLNQLLRVRPLTPPTSEIMIFLRYHKPLLYYTTKYAISKSSNLKMLFDIQGDIHVALERLEEYVRQDAQKSS